MNTHDKSAIHDNMEELVKSVKNYKNIIEQLLKKNVVTQEMINILNGNVNEAARKEELFKLITKRGPTAFDRLLEVFELTDNLELAQFLRKYKKLNSIDGWSNHIGQRKPKYILPRTDSMEYSMEGTPCGTVLLVNISNFENDAHPKRLGSERDVAAILELFTNLGHEVIILQDVSKEEFINKFTEFVDTFHTNCLTLFFMTHGHTQDSESVNLITRDNLSINTNWILERLNSKNAPRLANKPKLLFINACRGERFDGGIVINDDDEQAYLRTKTRNMKIQTDGKSVKLMRTLSDLLLVFPCIPGSVALRDTIRGSWFIHSLVREFKKEANITDVETMLKKIDMFLLNYSKETMSPFQTICTMSYGFNKRLYLVPRERQMISIHRSHPSVTKIIDRHMVSA